MASPIVTVRDLSKTFGATRALGGVDLDLWPGEVHALVGENGAGKSTLVRILAGVHRPDQGRISIDGREARLASPHDAIAAGIVTIPQELRLVPGLSVAENVMLGALPVRSMLGVPVIDRRRMREEARTALEVLGLEPDLDARVGTLAYVERQLVAIAKALRQRCLLLILDEPTAALETREAERLFAILERVKAQGTAIVYVSHKLDEVVTLADRCTVLRDGRITAASRRGAFAVGDLVQAMTGRPVGAAQVVLPERGAVVVEDTEEREDGVSLHALEVVGLTGLIGSGTERVLGRLFGSGAAASTVRVAGKAIDLDSPADAIAAGIGMVPGERRLGLVMPLSVRDNILLACLDRHARNGVLDRVKGDRIVASLIAALDIRPADPGARVSALSGGNQQKVILAKWLAREVGVLLLDEPTQGIDVGAKAQIHDRIRTFAAEGGAVLLSSSDLAEVTQVCDRVLAMHHGQIAAELTRAQGWDEAKLHAAIGG